MSEMDRVLDKLDELGRGQTQTLTEIARLQEQVKGIPDHEGRIRSLERWKWGLVGVTSLLTTGFSAYASTKGA